MRLTVIAFLVVVAIAGLLWLGVISRQDLQSTGQRAASDARVLEHKITAQVTISPQAIADAKICRENLKRLESAKRAVAEQRNQSTGTVSWDDVLHYLHLTKPPVCPDGGEYSLNDLSHVATCSISGNGTASTVDDHSIENY